jgi:hypothetical protein
VPLGCGGGRATNPGQPDAAWFDMQVGKVIDKAGLEIILNLIDDDAFSGEFVSITRAARR